jgi:nucleotide-binding universal stress UspA family protein
VRAAVDLHRADLGRVVLAVVTPYDAELDDAARSLQEAAGAIEPIEPTVVELRGEPVAALRSYATDVGLDLMVIGARGRGRSSSPLGSVATRLASGSPVPVLMGPGPPAP